MACALRQQDHKTLFWLMLSLACSTTTVLAMDCGCPETCTRQVLLKWQKNMHFSCEMRIVHLMSRYGDSEEKACRGASTGREPPCPIECNPDECGRLIAPKQKFDTGSNTNNNNNDNQRPALQFVFILLTMMTMVAFVHGKKKKKFLKAGDGFATNKDTSSRREQLPRSVRARLKR